MLAWIASFVADVESRLSALIGALIASKLSAFLPGFDANDFRLRFRGEIELHNVSVSRVAMSFLKNITPWEFQTLVIRKISIRLPLFNLLEDRLAVELEGFNVVFAAEDVNAGRQVERPKECFTPALQTIPPLPPDPISSERAFDADSTQFTSPILRIAIALIQQSHVQLSDIHARISDSVTNPAHPHQLSIRLNSVKFGASDRDGTVLEPDLVTYRPTIYWALALSNLKVSLNAPTEIDSISADDLVINHPHSVVIVAGLRFGTTADHVDVGLLSDTAPFLTIDLRLAAITFSVADEHMAFIWDLLYRLNLWMRRRSVGGSHFLFTQPIPSISDNSCNGCVLWGVFAMDPAGGGASVVLSSMKN